MTDTFYPHTVTISGADDKVDPELLVELSSKFPFVEWGILMSRTQIGRGRYPTNEWISRLLRAVGRRDVKLSAHFCGSMARDTLAGDDRCVMNLSPAFQRIQLNGYGGDWPSLKVSDGLRRLSQRLGDRMPAVILQARSLLNVVRARQEAPDLRLGGILVDSSGGTGREDTSLWFEAGSSSPVDLPRLPGGMGFAGGIEPGNVVSMLNIIQSARRETYVPYWIDMESGVRQHNEHFDLNLVTEVLQKVHDWMNPPPSPCSMCEGDEGRPADTHGRINLCAKHEEAFEKFRREELGR